MSSAAKSSPKTEKLEVGEGASDARPNPMLLITAKAKKAHSTTSTERIPAPTSLLEKVKTFLPRSVAHVEFFLFKTAVNSKVAISLQSA